MPARFAIVLGRRAVEPALGELLERRVEDLLAPLLGALPLRLYDHAADVSDYSLACQVPRHPSRSSSVSREWNGSASARSKARSAPGNGPWSR